MSDGVVWFALIGGELLTALTVLLSVSWWRNRAQRMSDRKAIAAFIAGVKQRRVERDESIRSFLSGNFNLVDSALNAKAIEITREEMRLYESFANLYLKRDAAGVKAFGQVVEAATAPYRTLASGDANGACDPASNIAPRVTVEAEADDGELRRLRDENEQLQTELQITMHTISRMLNEYSAMFDGGQADLAPIVPDAAEADQANVLENDAKTHMSEGEGRDEEPTMSLDDAWGQEVRESNEAESTNEIVIASDDMSAFDEQVDRSAKDASPYEQTTDVNISQESDELNRNDVSDLVTDRPDDEGTSKQEIESEVVDGVAETKGIEPTQGVVLESGDNQRVTDSSTDDLLANALGDADLALDNLDDLFDGISDDTASTSNADRRDVSA